MTINKSKGNMYPFVSHTWNPIKGKCPHNCSYCLIDGTKILMDDFSVKNIEDVKTGDFIIGLKKDKIGFYKFTVSKVKNISKHTAQTIIIKTEHNTLQVTPEHLLIGSTKVRNCSDWRMAKSYSPYQHLRYINTPKEFTQEKKIGWITGFCDGDGCFFKSNRQQGFEAVCTDERLSNVFINICKEFGIELKKGWKTSSKNNPFKSGTKYSMITTRAFIPTNKLKEIAIFPSNPSIDFMKGYLAGMLDTDGNVSGDSIRIAQSKIVNKIKYDRIIFCCKGLGLEYREEKGGIRILANLKRRLAFVFDFGLQHSKKRNYLILESSYKGSYHSEIISIEKGNEAEVYNLETECGNYIANGFIVHNCYMKRFPVGELRLVEKEFKTNLGKSNFIFVGSSTDMFAQEIPKRWIEKVLDKCFLYDNTYLFQSKNPKRFMDFFFPPKTILGTTLETDGYKIKISNAPPLIDRMRIMKMCSLRKMISIEPIMDFTLATFPNWIKEIKPEFISIGADSKGHNLPEPSEEKIKALIKELSKFTEVKIKDNLKRLKCTTSKI